MLRIPNSLMQQDIYIEYFQGNSGVGAIHAAPVKENGRFEPTQQKTIDYKGTEVTSSGKLYLYPYVYINTQSKVTINGQTYEAIKVTPLIGFKNVVYIEVMLQ